MAARSGSPDAAWFASVLDAKDDLVPVTGPRSHLPWGNGALPEYHGTSDDELHSLVDEERSDPDDTLRHVRDDRRVSVERAAVDAPSEPVSDHLGETRFFHKWKHPVLDDEGKVVMQVGVSRALAGDDPIESSSHLREQGHASTRNVRALIRSMPAPVVMLDAAHRIIVWNDAFERITGNVGSGPSANLLYADYEETLEARLPLFDEFEAIVHGVEPTSHVLEIENAKGESRAFSVDCRTWTGASEVVGGTLAIFHDVTDMLANEQRLRDANEELAQFNCRVSHDIFAPISTARGYLELAIEEVGSEDPEELAELLVTAREQLDKLDALVADLSSLARTEAETHRGETVDLEALVDVIRIDNAAASGDTITIDTDLVPDRFRSDPRRIRQMLSNLIDNAAKYHDPEESEPCVTVSSRRIGEAFVIEVSDNGIGIDPGFGARAFEMFTRGGSSAPGTGLGLYIIRKHADRLGATLSIESHAKPTVMRITLPGSCDVAA